MESILEKADQKIQTGKVDDYKGDEWRLKNPDAEVDIFKEFRTIIMTLQTNPSDFSQIVERLTAEITSLERLKQLSSCMIEGN
jgi:hypothetical protein